MQFTTIDENSVRALLRYEDLIPLMHDALIDVSRGAVIQPVRQMLPVEAEQRYLGVMPAVTPAVMGAKLVCFYPKNAGTGHPTHLASILIFDPEHGVPLAVVDGRLVTEMRTAATSAAVTRRLADPASRSLALIGSGVQAEAHLEALQLDFDLDDIRVWSRNPDKAQDFANRHGARACGLPEAVEGADIVVCATNAIEPVLQGAWLKPGAHVNSVGSPRPNWRELDDATMAQTLIVDSREAVLREAGDVILSGATIAAEAGDVLGGTIEIDRTRTTVFKSVGLAVEDLVAARHVHDLFRQQTEQ